MDIEVTLNVVSRLHTHTLTHTHCIIYTNAQTHRDNILTYMQTHTYHRIHTYTHAYAHILCNILTHTRVCVYICILSFEMCTSWLFFAPLNNLSLFDLFSCYSHLVITFVFWTSKLFWTTWAVTVSVTGLVSLHNILNKFWVLLNTECLHWDGEC